MKFEDTIGVIPNVITKKQCKELIKLFDKQDSLGNTYKGETLGGIEKSKNSIDYDLFKHEEENQSSINLIANTFNQANLDWFKTFPFQELYDPSQTILNKTYYPLFQMQKYIKNEGHFNGWHVEKSNLNTSPRYLVFILYLNDVEEGGETEFLFKAEGEDDFFKVKPKAGTLVIHPTSWPYIHKGSMPLSNDKYILTTWLLYNK